MGSTNPLDLAMEAEDIRAQLKDNRGIQKEIAVVLGISEQAVSKAVRKGSRRVLSLAADLIAERAAMQRAEMDRIRNSFRRF